MSNFDERIKQGEAVKMRRQKSVARCVASFLTTVVSTPHLCTAIPAEFHMISGSHDSQTSAGKAWWKSF